eukprot:2075206-Amphidinium_carterae.1
MTQWMVCGQQDRVALCAQHLIAKHLAVDVWHPLMLQCNPHQQSALRGQGRNQVRGDKVVGTLLDIQHAELQIFANSYCDLLPHSCLVSLRCKKQAK